MPFPPLIFSLLLGAYHDCLDHNSGKACHPLYEPILAACRNDPGGCKNRLARDQRGALNFSRCTRQESCMVANGFTSRLLPGDERAEARDPYEAPYGISMEYHLSLKVPTGQELNSDNQSIVLAQLKANNDASPTVAIRWKGGDIITVTLRNPSGEVVAYRGTMKQGQWHSFVFRVTTGPVGRFIAEKNEETIADYRGPLGYPDTVNYFKFGLYDYTKTQKSELIVHYGTFARMKAFQP